MFRGADRVLSEVTDSLQMLKEVTERLAGRLSDD